MNLSKNLLAYLGILLLLGCESKNSNQYIFGYLSPGDFCAKGLASEKAYRITNASESCSPPELICPAVHCNWYVSQSLTSFTNSVPTEGIAINDQHVSQPNFDLKIFRVVGTAWTIEMVISGVKYIGTSDQIRVTQSQSANFTDQTWNSETSACVPSTTRLNIYYVEFLQNIDLHTNPNDLSSPSIQIRATAAGGSPTSPPATGDFMVVQAY